MHVTGVNVDVVWCEVRMSLMPVQRMRVMGRRNMFGSVDQWWEMAGAGDEEPIQTETWTDMT